MRMINQYTKDGVLISILKTNDRFIVKFEIGPFEQVYKFVENDKIFDSASIEKLITNDTMKKIFEVFDSMNINYKSMISD